MKLHKFKQLELTNTESAQVRAGEGGRTVGAGQVSDGGSSTTKEEEKTWWDEVVDFFFD